MQQASILAAILIYVLLAIAPFEHEVINENITMY